MIKATKVIYHNKAHPSALIAPIVLPALTSLFLL